MSAKYHRLDSHFKEDLNFDDVIPRNITFDDILTSIENDSKSAGPPYSAFSVNRRRFILAVVTAAGFFGPLCGAVYLPSIMLFQDIYNVSATVINATVSVYMTVFAIVVSISSRSPKDSSNSENSPCSVR
jgi:hypothetical protein